MTYQFREGLSTVRVELAGDVVFVIQTSPDATANFSFPLAALSPRPALVQQKDRHLKSALILAGMVAFAAIIVISIIWLTLDWWTFSAAFAVLVGAIVSAFYLIPTRHYAIFHRRSGVYAFSLKSGNSKENFDRAVATITQSISTQDKAPIPPEPVDKGPTGSC